MQAQFRRRWRRTLAALAASTIIAGALAAPSFADNDGNNRGPGKNNGPQAATPIKHVVIIFGENVSFDHYFATYPFATNQLTPAAKFPGGALFNAKDDTPSVNGLTSELLTANANLANPLRLRPADAFTCSQNHDYTSEQKAVDGGLMDKFIQATAATGTGCAADGSTVMNYFDGNTVTALWNYAQHYSMNDNSFGTQFGPSTVGALNLISAQTGGALLATAFSKNQIAASTPVTVTGDPDPALDDCGADVGGTKPNGTVEMTGKNVGDLLNAKGLTWGWFEGGFAATSPATLNADGTTAVPAKCAASHIGHQFGDPANPLLVVPNPTTTPGEIHVAQTDNSPHHEPFMYYASTRNMHHLRPSPDVAQEIGKQDQANHQYDITDFFAALAAHNLPAVSYLKAARYQDAHPSNSDPILEQIFIVQVLNALQQSPEWAETAVFIEYDDSDGWYDHMTGLIVNQSATGSINGQDDASTNANDSLIPTLPLSTSTAPASPQKIASSGVCGFAGPAGTIQGRCGYGPRLPFMVISPWAKANFIDHTLTDQSSSMRFIEDNFGLGFVDPASLGRDGSLDRLAGSVLNMFDFDDQPNVKPLILDPLAGRVLSGENGGHGQD
jgi:phospholipase C